MSGFLDRTGSTFSWTFCRMAMYQVHLKLKQKVKFILEHIFEENEYRNWIRLKKIKPKDDTRSVQSGNSKLAKRTKKFHLHLYGQETKVMMILKGTSIKTDFIATNTINRLIYRSFKKLNKVKCGISAA
jgi:hypothetical protein